MSGQVRTAILCCHRLVNLRPGEASDLDLARCAYLDRIDLAAILSMKFCKFE